jgi:tyrosyl-tRNA synthetase
LRDYGRHFTINRMLTFESVKQRLGREQPLTFLEFNYMIFQAYDFLELNRRYGCRLQMGGSDQWGNILSGVELGRRADNASLYAITAPLITTADGKKMGKSMGGAVWLNADLLSPYDYWQYWRNTADADVVRFLRLFTELPDERIEQLATLTGQAINDAKVVLADETTRMLHGAECLDGIRATAAELFAAGGGGGGTDAGNNLPTIEISPAELAAGMPVVDLFLRLNFAKSKSEVRRLIAAGGARLNDEKLDDEDLKLSADAFAAGDVKLSSGKKKHGVVKLSA